MACFLKATIVVPGLLKRGFWVFEKELSMPYYPFASPFLDLQASLLPASAVSQLAAVGATMSLSPIDEDASPNPSCLAN